MQSTEVLPKPRSPSQALLAHVSCLLYENTSVPLKCTHLRTGTAVSRAQKIHEGSSQAKQWKYWKQQSHCSNFTCRDVRTRLRLQTSALLCFSCCFFEPSEYLDMEGYTQAPWASLVIVLLPVKSTPLPNFSWALPVMKSKESVTWVQLPNHSSANKVFWKRRFYIYSKERANMKYFSRQREKQILRTLMIQ